MKNKLLIMSLSLMALTATAKDIKTIVVTTSPQMHCENCEAKIKNNIRFEKGVKDIATSVPDQTVTIKYDADKNSEEKIIKAFGKFGYTATKITPAPATKDKK